MSFLALLRGSRLCPRAVRCLSTATSTPAYNDMTFDDDVEGEKPTEVLQIAAFPYLRRMMKHEGQRNLVGTVVARVNAAPGSKLGELMEAQAGSSIDGVWIDFELMQNTVLPLLLNEVAPDERGDLIKGCEVFFSPPHNGRPGFMPGGNDTPPPENQTLAVEREQTLSPDPMYRLKPIDEDIETRLREFLANSDSNTSMDSIAFAQHLSPTSEQTKRRQILARTSGSVYDWRSLLTELDVNDTIEVVDADRRPYTQAIHIGGRLLLHKTTKGGPVWVSSMCEFVESLPSGMTILHHDKKNL